MKEVIFRNKLLSSKITLIIFQLFFISSFYGQSLKLTSSVQYVNLGDLDISGNQLTVEAKIYMTGYGVNVVSKHTDPSNVNYLLRPMTFEITTSNGFYLMNNPYTLELNKWYHIAGTYDGQYVRYYINGCLVIQNPATGNLFQNNLDTGIGNRSLNYQNIEQFIGLIDEVRIWNVCRSEIDINNNMNNLINPSSQVGLKGYYKFTNNLLNEANNLNNGIAVGSIQYDNESLPVNTFQYNGYNILNSSCNQYSVEILTNGSNLMYSLDGTNYISNNVLLINPGNQTVWIKNQEGCIITSTINFPLIVSSPTASSLQTFCGSATIADLSATGTNIQWYAVSTGGATLSNATLLVNGSTYYASQTQGGCESSVRTPVSVIVNINCPIPQIIATSNLNYCNTGSCEEISPSLTVSEPNSVIDGAKVYFTSNYINGEDILSFTSNFGITGSFDALTGVLSLIGSSTIANYEQVLKSVCYQNTSINPTPGSRGITYVIGNLVYNSLNQHFYKLVNSTNPVLWTEAKTNAENTSYFGLNGYLVTITNLQENNFINTLINSNSWLGANDTNTEGEWRWVTGCEATEDNGLGRLFSLQQINAMGISVNGNYNNWACVEPNNCCGGENYLHMIGANTILCGNFGEWNDYPNSGIPYIGSPPVYNYIIEYGCTNNPSYNNLSANVIITVNSNITPTFNQVSPICSGDTLNALPTTSNNNITGVWSPSLNNTTTTIYTFTPTAGQCASTTTMTIVVNSTLSPSGLSTQTFCNSATVASLTATGTNIKWYSSSTGGTSLANTTSLINGAVYYATQTISGCESSVRFPVTVVINSPSAPTGASTQTFCNSATIASLSATGSNIQWYATTIGGTPLSNTTALVNGTTYYASQTIVGCESLTRFPVNVIINTLPVPPTGSSNQLFCNSATVTNLTITGQNIQWYTTATGGSPLLSMTSLINGSTYYASQTINDCESILRTPVLVTITVVPTPTGNSVQEFCKIDNPIVSNLTPNLPNIKWYTTLAGLNPLNPNTQLIDNASYFAEDIDVTTGCKSPNRLEVLVKINDSNPPTGELEQIFCVEDNPTISNLIMNTSNTLVWYDSAAGNNIVVDTTPLSNGDSFYASNFDSTTNCYSSERTKVDITLLPCELEINNLLTLNGNNLNDFIVIKNIETFPKNEFQIFNRYGKLVWRGYNYNNLQNTFTGKANVQGVYNSNDYLPTGTYFYVLTYFDMYRNENKEVKGFLQINNNQ